MGFNSGFKGLKTVVELRFCNLPPTSRTVASISTERRLRLGFLEEEDMVLYERETRLSLS